jgi:heat shock protein HslJ
MTAMGCDPPRHDQDSWLAAFLTSGPAARMAGDELTLEGGGTIVVLVDRRVADPDRPLVGPTWQVETIVTGQSASSVPAGATATLVFGGDGRVSIDTGCNTGAGSYTGEGATLRFSALAMTKRACAGPAGELEQAVLGVLEAGTVDYAIEAAALTLMAGDRGLGLRAS